jgi:signal transduction histidine kinase
MDYLARYTKRARGRAFFAIFIPQLVTIGTVYVVNYFFELSLIASLAVGGGAGFITTICSMFILTNSLKKPLESISNMVSYTVHPESFTVMPDSQDSSLAHELVDSINRKIIDLASTQKQSSTQDYSAQLQEPLLLDGFATPLIQLNAEQKILSANKATAEYVGRPLSEIIGQQLYDVLSFSFQNDNTFENWLTNAKNDSVTATAQWERVRHDQNQDSPKQFDMVAHYSSGNSTGADIMLALFDKTERYSQDDQDVSFVAMAVHELRTPLTIMRGYIEVFEDELGPTLSPELADFMHKMHASAQQLTAFVSNILNVARVDENQLALTLKQEDWPTILTQAIDDLRLRASVHGITIELTIADTLPPVAVDRISIHEVLNNLVDNAIKYGGDGQKIIVNSILNNEGLVETSIQDFGIGIPTSVMPELFRKFHRSHKSKVQVGGTGLGLYLSKALVSAHGGNIWVRSKEGEGSTFSFTILPYDKVKQEQLAGEDGIIRGAHGWIKNHSLYRN